MRVPPFSCRHLFRVGELARRMNETIAIAVDDAAARRAVARALAAWGAAVRIDGDAVVLDGGALRGRVLIAGGQARFAIATGAREVVRVAQAAVVGAAASLATEIWCGWMFHRALPVGGAVAAAFGVAAIVRDRRRLRARLRALVASLPVLIE
jgi:hypothetical protein